MAITTPPGWLFNRLQPALDAVARAQAQPVTPARLIVRKLQIADLGAALRAGFADFSANRTDILFLCLVYPVVGLMFGRAASGYGLLPLLFPLASGFALVGPFAAVGLNEMSRRREMGEPAGWTTAFSIFQHRAIGSILLLGLVLGGLLALWLEVAQVIFAATIGDQMPATLGMFAQDLFTTPPGWALIVFGCGAGFVFAVAALSIGVVSFPLLLDRNVGINVAVATSFRAVAANPVPMAVWGLIVAAGLVLGSIPLFVGLVVVMPVLGHATWHLYRATIR